MRTAMIRGAGRLLVPILTTLVLLFAQPAYAREAPGLSAQDPQPAQLPGSADRPVLAITGSGTRGGTRGGQTGGGTPETPETPTAATPRTPATADTPTGAADTPTRTDTEDNTVDEDDGVVLGEERPPDPTSAVVVAGGLLGLGGILFLIRRLLA